jgi:putative transposase
MWVGEDPRRKRSWRRSPRIIASWGSGGSWGAPWPNPFVERVIGSIRRECLDHFLILSEGHLRRFLHAYGAYYNTTRPHQSLDNNNPQPRVVEPPPCGRIIATSQVGGLHHRYQRAA